jgi:hypothetical protein
MPKKKGKLDLLPLILPLHHSFTIFRNEWDSKLSQPWTLYERMLKKKKKKWHNWSISVTDYCYSVKK